VLRILQISKGAGKKIAQLFSDFVGQASQSLHIAIYDFRLEEPEAQIVIDALNKAAESGIDVRVAYFQPSKKRASPSEFSFLGSDPAPGSDEAFFGRFHKDIPFKAIADVSSLPVEGGDHLMHSKYIICDGLAPSVVVWTGSANFTTDAWSIQDNNIVILNHKILQIIMKLTLQNYRRQDGLPEQERMIMEKLKSTR